MSYQQVLKDRYGLNAEQIQETTGGWSARAYQVTAGSRQLFLKVYDTTRASVLPFVERMDGYLPAMDWLQMNTALGRRMPPLYKTADGALFAQHGTERLLLFSFVEGEVPGSRPLTLSQRKELAEMAAELHNCALADLPFSPAGLEEDASPQLFADLRRYLSSPQILSERTWKLLEKYLPQLMQGTKRTEELLDTARKPCRNLVLCHTDMHNWNLLQGDRLYLLDWEGLCVAPPEADLYAFSEWEDFMAVYRAKRNGYRLDADLTEYYALRRRLTDIYEFIVQIEEEDPESRTAQGAYKHLEKECTALCGLLEK